ncbi:hypothetical protein EDB85DRAFT_1042950 [Lactarius pseudohatsudake]|nr:hypothetical protein EDB85DRAFT_1042950 [Lactarius pseudohatsudake]
MSLECAAPYLFTAGNTVLWCARSHRDSGPPSRRGRGNHCLSHFTASAVTPPTLLTPPGSPSLRLPSFLPSAFSCPSGTFFPLPIPPAPAQLPAHACWDLLTLPAVSPTSLLTALTIAPFSLPPSPRPDPCYASPFPYPHAFAFFLPSHNPRCPLTAPPTPSTPSSSSSVTHSWHSRGSFHLRLLLAHVSSPSCLQLNSASPLPII